MAGRTRETGGTRDMEGGGVGVGSSAARPSQAISPRIDSSIRVAIRVLLIGQRWRAVPAPFRPCQGGVGASGTSTGMSVEREGFRKVTET